MSSTKKPTLNDAVEFATAFHLATPKSQGKPLCGEQSSDVEIGSYWEHLDGRGEFVREVFSKTGKPVRACARCLSLYPSLAMPSRDERELRRITPFNLHVNVAFAPDTRFSGYRVDANGIAEIEDKRIVICAFPQLTFVSARWFCDLRFNVDVDASLVVPLVNNANKDE